MIPKPAQYLLRFDDLCPTMPQERWGQFRDVMEEFRIRPILAVIPDNQDPSMRFTVRNPAFWDEMRAMETAGAAIAVHGYRHVCASFGKSLLGIHRHSEFAGVDAETQREWIRKGIAILREQGLTPRLWTGPRHGFDANTLAALHGEGMKYISDGFARVPFRRGAVMWIPQQLWSPVFKAKGLWTVCIHPCSARTAEVDRLRWFLKGHWPQFTSFDRVVTEFGARKPGLRELVYEKVALWRVQLRHERARRRRG